MRLAHDIVHLSCIIKIFSSHPCSVAIVLVLFVRRQNGFISSFYLANRDKCITFSFNLRVHTMVFDVSRVKPLLVYVSCRPLHLRPKVYFSMPIHLGRSSCIWGGGFSHITIQISSTIRYTDVTRYTMSKIICFDEIII